MSKQAQSQLQIRPLHPQDSEAIHTIFTHPDVVRTTTYMPSREYQKTAAWVAEEDLHHHRFVAVKEGNVVGLGTLLHYSRARRNHAGELNLFIHPNHWRQGVGTALMQAIVDLTDNWLGLVRTELEVVAINQAAIGLYQKFGFVIEGTQKEAIFVDGRWENVIFMGRIKT